jgi:ABC-2 type transport system ATP-binding protein
MLECSNIYKAYRGMDVIKNMSFSLAPADCLIVTGRNGSGKTTLLKIISSSIEQDTGSIKLNQDDNIRNLFLYRRNVEGCFPSEYGFFSHLTFFENLRIFALLNGQTKNEFLNSLETIKKFLPIEVLLTKIFYTASRGNKQLLHITRSLILDRDLYILDEPYHYLDTKALDGLKNIISEFVNNKKMFVISAQNSDQHWPKYKHIELG